MWYITKYALTQGIWEVHEDNAHFHQNFPQGDLNIDYLYVGQRGRCTNQFNKTEFFPTLEAAQARAANMIENKIRSLEKQLSKFRKMATGPCVVVPALQDQRFPEDKGGGF